MRHRPWSGFLHAGGVLSDDLVVRQTASAVRNAFAPKVCCHTITHLDLVVRKQH